jgi:ribonuclease HII
MGWLIDRLITDRSFLSSEEIYQRVGFAHVVGVTVEGRPAIAGPVTVSAVIIPPNQRIKYNQNLKLLTAEECNILSDDIKYRATSASLGWGTVFDISSKSLDATIQHALRVSLGVFSKWDPVSLIILDNVILDPMPINLVDSGIPVVSIKSASDFLEPVIAARIVARSARNTLMNVLHESYPQYGFNTNKGYATAQHLEAIREYGPCELHRPPRKKNNAISNIS